MVEIPADVAKGMAEHFRSQARLSSVAAWANEADEWADLLDPKPPTLREQVRVAAMLADNGPGWRAVWNVLAVVRERVETLCLPEPAPGGVDVGWQLAIDKVVAMLDEEIQ